ncbi:hypothetical protein M153_4230005439 [Pseudoloma neurophilia]|uniref:Secreted protein n=1 Tax=Pseudoloma neurophilia TaxID=146866 RepID=A0A0R0LXJ9_9MICR|nr:hypothetical protein M153_4230005439 [Pseudoloma neurophilia]
MICFFLIFSFLNHFTCANENSESIEVLDQFLEETSKKIEELNQVDQQIEVMVENIFRSTSFIEQNQMKQPLKDLIDQRKQISNFLNEEHLKLLNTNKLIVTILNWCTEDD